jgi:hypothetical protein
MFSHALTIVINELNAHLASAYDTGGGPPSTPGASLGNLTEGVVTSSGNGGVPRDTLVFSVVNIREEKTLKNVTNVTRNGVTLKAIYANPPVFINLLILVAATHTNYTNALTALSRVARFFQSRNVFTQDDVALDSMQTPTINQLDQLGSFKLIFDLYSPTLEEVNHLWGTLGGKQYPFVLYTMRMLELKFVAVQNESGLITQVVADFNHTEEPGRS